MYVELITPHGMEGMIVGFWVHPMWGGPMLLLFRVFGLLFYECFMVFLLACVTNLCACSVKMRVTAREERLAESTSR